MQNRRGFLKSSSIATLGLLSLSENLYSINKFPDRKIKISLMPGSVGINVNAYELINLAIKNINTDSRWSKLAVRLLIIESYLKRVSI